VLNRKFNASKSPTFHILTVGIHTKQHSQKMTFYIIIGVVLFFIIMYFIGDKDEKKKNNSSTKAEKKVSKKRINSSKKEINSSKWEIVYRNSQRWNELGFQSGELFPGYGKLFEREFEVWYSDVGSKEKKDIQKFNDKFPLNYTPNNSSEITGENVHLERLEKTKGYEALFSGLDNKNRKRWYFALVNTIPTWIEVEREIEKEGIESEYIPEPIEIPEGWELVRRKTTKWKELGFGDNELFPGYGKIYEREFSVWYNEIGSKEKNIQPDFTDKAIINLKKVIYSNIAELSNKNLEFNYLEKKQGFKMLLTTVDKNERKRWYFGLKETEPTYIFTESAE